LDSLTPPPWQLQPVIDDNTIITHIKDIQVKRKKLSDIVELNGEKSTNVLGDDLGYPFDVSSSGLKRNRHGVFRPVIDNRIGWQHVKPPTGIRLNESKFRRDFDALRYPRHLQSSIAMEGGGTINMDRAYKKMGFI